MNSMLNVIARLRDPEKGCPWDRRQTHHGLKRFLLEECYELLSAIESQNDEQLLDELGDVLLQILLHAQIASEEKRFNFMDVVAHLEKKIMRRHPHVFDTSSPKLSEGQVKDNWEKIKAKERQTSQATPYYLKPELLHLPALLSAQKIGEKTQRIKFDWENAREVAQKVREEWDELQDELAQTPCNQQRVQEEFGDFAFSVAQWGRHLGFDVEDTLRQANKKFLKRFQQVEDLVRKSNKSFEECSRNELEHFWNEVKKNEN